MDGSVNEALPLISGLDTSASVQSSNATLKTEFTTNELIAFFTQPVENHSAGVIILMVCFYIGMGFIYQSAVFKEGGIAVVAVVYIIVAYASYIACKLLLRCAEKSNIYNYSDMVRYYYGDAGEWLSDIGLVIFFGFGTIVPVMTIGALTRTVIVTYHPSISNEWYISSST
jgi:amino acid permease